MKTKDFGWALKRNRGNTGEGNHKQIDHATLFGWQTRPPSPRASSPYKSFVNSRNMAEQKKQERDFTPEVDAIIPETTSLAQVSCVTSMLFFRS